MRKEAPKSKFNRFKVFKTKSFRENNLRGGLKNAYRVQIWGRKWFGKQEEKISWLRLWAQSVWASRFKEKKVKRPNYPRIWAGGRPATFSGWPAILFLKTGRWPPLGKITGRWWSPHAHLALCKFWGRLEFSGPEKVQEKCTFWREIAPPEFQLQFLTCVSSSFIKIKVVTSPGGEPEATIESPSPKRAFPCSPFHDKHASWSAIVLHHYASNLHSHEHTCIVMHVFLILPCLCA